MFTTQQLLLVGIFTQVGLTKSMQTETAGRATAFSYLQVVFAVLLGWIIFEEIPDLDSSPPTILTVRVSEQV